MFFEAHCSLNTESSRFVGFDSFRIKISPIGVQMLYTTDILQSSCST